MKTKKKLESYVDNSLSAYENKEFLEKLKSNVPAEKSNGKLKKRRSLVFSCVGAVVVIAICLGVFIGQPWLINDGDTETPNKKLYSSSDEITEDILLDDLNSNIAGIMFNCDGLKSSQKIINTLYNEELLYILKYNYNETIETVNIMISVNEEYGYVFAHNEYDSKATIQGHEINYIETYEYEDEFYFFVTKGEIVLNKVKIYIEYEDAREEETSDFLNILNSIILS